jgi:hypothetical protein
MFENWKICFLKEITNNFLLSAAIILVDYK